MAAKIRNALMLYRPLCAAENIEIRLHRTVLYNSIYRADEQSPGQPAQLWHPGGTSTRLLPARY